MDNYYIVIALCQYREEPMKLLYALIFSVFLSPVSFGQGRVSELINNLSNTHTDSGKVSAYMKIMAYYAVSNPDSQSWYANEAINYSRSKNYKKGEADINAKLSLSDKAQARSALAEQRVNTALKIYREINDLKAVAEMLHNLGSIEATKSNFDVATKYYVQALKIYDTITDPHGQILTYMHLGNIYLAHSDTTNAWKYLRLAEAVSNKAPLSDATILLNNVIGMVLAVTDRFDTALKIFNKNLELSNKPEFLKAHIECLIYMGEGYIGIGNNKEGLKYLEKALAIAEENNLPEMEGNALYDLASITEQSNPTLAIQYLNKSKVLYERLQNKAALVDIYKNIGKIYKQLGKYKEALEAHEQSHALADSIFSINKSKEISSIDNAYKLETNKRIKELAALNRHNARQRDELIIFAVCLILALLITVSYYRKTIRLNKKLTAHEKKLEELNSMKDKLFSVIGHDLRGPIARIPNIIDIYEDPSTTEDEKKFLLDNLKEHTKASLETFDKLLYWGQTLVKGISLHMIKMQTKGYIKEAIDLKKMKASEKNITITDHTTADVFVYSDPSLFDFIIRNLLANALKYTFKDGTIDIGADKTTNPGFTVFWVQDSGIGIDKEKIPTLFYSLKSEKGTDNEKGHGIGLMLCKEFAVQNGGDIWVESEVGKGTTFYFSVKNVA